MYIVAHYENCVKETMISYASRHNQEFEGFVERHYDKLNSKIDPNNLRQYAKLLDPRLGEEFKLTLERRRKLFSKLSGRNVEKQLRTILGWRHEYAHAGNLVTTVEEALRTHRLAKIPIQTFEEVLSSH